ncbi:MAG TPA: integrase core domain-containing protein, partial [Bacillota bacterium]|nr:integrase core domain-containing protein [Bacillota bacterium]
MYIDVFNNEVLSSSVSEDRRGHNFKGHMNALKRFLEEKTKRGYTSVETILHSDQGPVYTSRAFYNAHKDYNIIRSMSRVGTPTDNPKIESINGWMKADLYIDFKLYQSNSIQETINQYIEYFNHDRLASCLQYKTPIQVKLESGFR